MKKLSLIASLFVSLFIGSQALAQAPTKALLDPVLRNEIVKFNEAQSLMPQYRPFSLLRGESIAPFAEYEEAGYLVFSGDYDFNSKAVKLGLVKNIPNNVDVIIFSSQKGAALDRIRKDYENLIDPQRLHVVHIPDGRNAFWTRDALPVPLNSTGNPATPGLRLVDARYYHGFSSDKFFADLFGAPLTRHNYYFEGGNFMVNRLGDCIAVDNELVSKIPDEVFEESYGCKTMLRLPHIRGIGHVDETIKVIDDRVVMTDEVRYVDALNKAGFSTIMVPRAKRQYETYVNALLINNTMYVPVYNDLTDLEAIKVYEDQGYNVVPLETIQLSNVGLGSIHCITMTYPPLPLATVLSHLGAVTE